MEPNNVLKRFLDVCSNKDGKCTRYSFASNGILEWFGRNIKDNNKIFDYIRYNISHQYEHIFSVAIRCEAFEEKPLHKATRQQLPETVTNVSNSKSEYIYETPPSCSVSKDDMRTPEKTLRSDATRTKFCDTDDEKSSPSSVRVTRNSRKRNLHIPQETSPTKRNKNNSKHESDHLSVCTETLETDAEPHISKNNQPVDVSEIKYIEAVGTVRKLRKLKHRGIDSRSKDVRIYESPTRQHWDAGNTKLKISYRENANKNDVQFVLVMYQHIENNPRCRRDLMAEFAKTCAEETPEPQKSEKKNKMNKNLKMRRLRF